MELSYDCCVEFCVEYSGQLEGGFTRHVRGGCLRGDTAQIGGAADQRL